jgi:uncharacterized integral membrane protein (TIGR00698 family)
MINIKSLAQNWRGIIIAIIVGVIAVLIREFFGSPILDPLLVALVIGIILRSFIRFNDKFIFGFKLTPLLFIPIGVIFYGAVNLDFVKFASVNPMFIFIVIIVFIVYLTSTFLLSIMLNIDDKTTYLIAAGSAVCGASAIAITSNAVDAEPDDVSNSLIPVFLSALLGLFVFLPFLAVVLRMTGLDYAIMAGAVLQFTGFVKAAITNIPVASANVNDLLSLALSVKAVRYIGLLILIPLFASFVRGRFYVPWYLWGFLMAGLIFSFVPDLARAMNPIFKPALTYLWSIAMAAIGLNANLKTLFSANGFKAFIVSFFSFAIATSVFLGMYLVLRELIIL